MQPATTYILSKIAVQLFQSTSYVQQFEFIREHQGARVFRITHQLLVFWYNANKCYYKVWMEHWINITMLGTGPIVSKIKYHFHFSASTKYVAFPYIHFWFMQFHIILKKLNPLSSPLLHHYSSPTSIHPHKTEIPTPNVVFCPFSENTSISSLFVVFTFVTYIATIHACT